MTDEVKGNADRNEMIALLQHAAGAQFVSIRPQSYTIRAADSIDLEEDDVDAAPYPYNRIGKLENAKPKPKTASSVPALTYKAINLALGVGDMVIVQYKSRFAIGLVDVVMEEPPTSVEYDYRLPIRNVVQKIDVGLSEGLSLMDREMLKKITRSESKDRLERITRQLGIDVSSITLEIPKIVD